MRDATIALALAGLTFLLTVIWGGPFIAVLRRFRFGKKSEQINGVQGSLLEEAVAADIAAIEEELHQLTDHPKKAAPREQPRTLRKLT